MAMEEPVVEQAAVEQAVLEHMVEQAVVEQAVLEHMEEQAVVEQAVDVEDMEEVQIRFPNDQSFDQVKKIKTGM